MTDKEDLKEMTRQERRFAVANCGRGLLLMKSAREYHDRIFECTLKGCVQGLMEMGERGNCAI